jgi:hypothetical protein
MVAALNEQRNKELGILIDCIRDPLKDPEPRPDDPYLKQIQDLNDLTKTIKHPRAALASGENSHFNPRNRR